MGNVLQSIVSLEMYSNSVNQPIEEHGNGETRERELIFFISRQSGEHKKVENNAKNRQTLMIQATTNHACDANSTNRSENIKKQNMEKEQTNILKLVHFRSA